MTQIILSPAQYKYSFDQIRAKLGELIYSVTPLISDMIPSLEEFKKYLRRCFRELRPQLAIAQTFDDIMDAVEEKCTIINICCLETIVNYYKVKEAQNYITAYKSEVDVFCAEVKLNVCENKDFITGPSSLLKCDTIEFVLGWKTDEHTLNEIRDLLWKAFGDMANKIFVKELKKGNSIIITCYAPQNVMNILLMEAEKNLHLLINLGLIKLSIGYITLWNVHARVKV